MHQSYPSGDVILSGHNGQMNPRRVHELMRLHFPEVHSHTREWIVAADENGLRSAVLSDLLEKYVPTGNLLVEVNRKVGDLLPMQAAVAFVAEHIGKGEIRVSDREFTGFVVVTANGVATGWSATNKPGEPAQC